HTWMTCGPSGENWVPMFWTNQFAMKMEPTYPTTSADFTAYPPNQLQSCHYTSFTSLYVSISRGETRNLKRTSRARSTRPVGGRQERGSNSPSQSSIETDMQAATKIVVVTGAGSGMGRQVAL